MDQHHDKEHNTQEEWHPLCLHTLVNASDMPSWEEAMNGPDKAGY